MYERRLIEAGYPILEGIFHFQSNCQVDESRLTGSLTHLSAEKEEALGCAVGLPAIRGLDFARRVPV